MHLDAGMTHIMFQFRAEAAPVDGVAEAMILAATPGIERGNQQPALYRHLAEREALRTAVAQASGAFMTALEDFGAVAITK
jgi:hypothetical protein